MRRLFSFIPNAAIAAVLILPGIILTNPDYLATFPPEHQAGLVFLSGIGVWGMWAFAVQLVRVTARELYFPNPDYVRLSKARVLSYAAASYFLTIYAFSIAFAIVQQQSKVFAPDKPAFVESLSSLVDALYFSIVTIATVGYGDIAPKTPIARILVSFEVLAGVGYSVFFFSIIAGFIRERDTP
jgi:Ion channel